MSDLFYKSSDGFPGATKNATLGYKSALQTGGTTFVAPITVPLSGVVEGEWIKLVGLSGVGNKMTVANDTITVEEAGRYQIAFSSMFKKNATGDRNIFFSIAVNALDANKPGINDLTPFCGSTGSEAQDFSNAAGVEEFDLLASDTLKIFVMMCDGNTQDIDVGLVCLSVHKL